MPKTHCDGKPFADAAPFEPGLRASRRGVEAGKPYAQRVPRPKRRRPMKVVGGYYTDEGLVVVYERADGSPFERLVGWL